MAGTYSIHNIICLIRAYHTQKRYAPHGLRPRVEGDGLEARVQREPKVVEAPALGYEF